MPGFPVIDKVLEIHADEMAFLYTQRKNAIVSPAFNLLDIAHLDNRLIGHIDGLLLGGDNSWAFCEQGLGFEESGEVFAAASFSIASQDFSKLDVVFEVAGEDSALLDAIADAFIWSNYEAVKLPLQKLLQQQDDKKSYVALTALCGLRLGLDKHEQQLVRFLKSDNAILYQQALNTIGIMGIQSLKSHLDIAMQSEDEDIVFTSSWSATRFGNADAMEKIKGFVTHPIYGEKALQLVILQKDIDDTIDILRQLYQDDATKRLSIAGLGYIGKANAIQNLIQVMEIPGLSRIAGHAFSMITGLDLEQSGLTKDQPEEINAEPSDETQDDNMEMDPDEDLPWPDSKKIAVWWSLSENQNRYLSTERYLGGEPLSNAQLQRTLHSGNQLERIFAANCLAVYERDTPLFNVYSPAKYQFSALAS